MMTSATKKNIATINVEDYFQVGAFARLIPFAHWERFDSRLKRNTDAALSLLDETASTATFFANGWIGDNHPDVLRTISDEGHEIACSSYYQQAIRDISPIAFREDLRRSRQAIQQAVGKEVRGFRVGRGAIGPDDLWAIDILCEETFLFDSSLRPIGRQFAGQVKKFFPHRIQGASGEIWEVPISVTQILGWAVPFSGGNYLRQIPGPLIRTAVQRWVERGDAPLVLYFHLWELDTDQPRLSSASWLQRMRHYRNLSGMADLVHYFLDRYPFSTITDHLEFHSEEPAPVAPSSRYVADLETAPRRHLIQRQTLDIVVPCFNEQATVNYLGKTLDDFIQASATELDLSFIFVDDGSEDETWLELQKQFGSRADCTLVQLEENGGIAAAIVAGIARARAELVAVIDADCTFDPMQLLTMVPLMRDDVVAVAASPFHAQGRVANVPPWRLGLSHSVAFLYRRVLHHKFSNYTSCFRIYRRSAVQDLAVYKRGFCGVAEILARLDLAGHKLVECPAELQTRVVGHSKINLLRTVADHLELIARIAIARWLGVPLPSKAEG